MCFPRSTLSAWMTEGGGSGAAAEWASEAHAVPGRQQIASSVVAIPSEGGREIEARMTPTSLKWTEREAGGQERGRADGRVL